MAYVVWRVLLKQYSKVRLGIQRNPSVEDEISPTTRRTKSFDDQAWKVHDETVNLSANISAISTTALAIRSPQVDYDLESLGSTREPRSRSSGLDEVLVAGGTEDSATLNRGEVRKSRSKMKSYLKRCKDVLISGVVGHTGGVTPSCPNASSPEDHQDVVVYHAQSDESQPNSASCWYLDDHLMELRPEDNREPYSSLASARLKSELEESRMARERRLNEVSEVGAEVPTANVTTIVTNTSSSSIAKIGEISEHLTESTSIADVIPEDPGPTPELHADALPGDCLSSAHGSSGSGSSSSSIESLIDHYLGPLYPDYVDHTRPMLIRQARDLLVCTFHGDLERFEADFLRPATDIVRELRCAYQRGKAQNDDGLR
ncbi:uncharacterized protein LOC128303061 [Anopheles moucheti]|uniref:uncharacterized protein LOC128303061 n=1 Tax=Anopheles moucheti TaxID=186751 RepID=UPI0022F0C638|nr:uncharacterized protein LOC128303061 [Anopheles moucheti]